MMQTTPRHGSARRYLAGTALAASLILLAGCAGGTASGSGSAAPTGNADVAAAQEIADSYVEIPTKILQDVPLEEAPPKEGLFIYVTSGLPATTLMVEGAHEAVDAIGWDFEELSYDGTNPATIRSALLTALSKNPSAVAISGNPPTVYGDDVIAEYEKAGVPLIVGSVCPLEASGSIQQGALGCEAEEAGGQALANWFIADSEGTGQALFQNIPSIPSLEAFVKAFQAEVEAKCADCSVQVIETTIDQVGSNQIVPTVVNSLRANPDLNYVFFDNAQWSKGIVPALEAAGIADQVKIGGRSMDEGAQGGLLDGTQAAWTALAYNVAGYSNVDTALRLITESDGLDKVSVLPLQLVTQDSVKGTDVPYRYPADALDQYLALWQVK